MCGITNGLFQYMYIPMGLCKLAEGYVTTYHKQYEKTHKVLFIHFLRLLDFSAITLLMAPLLSCQLIMNN